VLVDDTSMPKPDQLPESISKLAYLNAIRLDTGADFDTHIERLIKVLERHERPAEYARGKNIALAIEVPLEEALRGGARHLTLPDGQLAQIGVPKGVRDGSQMILPGRGEAGNGGGAAGDLVVKFHLLPHPVYERDEGDLTSDLVIDEQLAGEGGAQDVLGPTGQLSVEVPARSRAGTVLRVKGKGLPAYGNAREGDLLLRLKIVVPEKIAAPEEAAPSVVAPDAAPPKAAAPDAVAPGVIVPDVAAASVVDPKVVATDVTVGASLLEPQWSTQEPDGRRWLGPAFATCLILLIAAVAVWIALGNRQQGSQAAQTPLAENSGPEPPAAAPDAAPDATPALSADEQAAVQQADAQAALASQQAAAADDAKAQALQTADQARDKAKSDSGPALSAPYSVAVDAPQPMPAPSAYSGERSAGLPDGLGVMTGSPDLSTCKPHADGVPPEQEYAGQFSNGLMDGLGVYHQCFNGYTYYGKYKANHPDGTGISIRFDGKSFSGQFSQGTTVLGVTRHSDSDVAKDGVAYEAGGMNSVGKLQGSGVVTCSDKTKWKGGWDNGQLSGYAVRYDENWVPKMHDNYGPGNRPSSLCGP
jgi:hypothetical protein